MPDSEDVVTPLLRPAPLGDPAAWRARARSPVATLSECDAPAAPAGFGGCVAGPGLAPGAPPRARRAGLGVE